MSMFHTRGVAFALFVILAGCSGGNPLDTSSDAEKAEALVSNSRAALDQLRKQAPGTEGIAKNAKGLLVFPSIVKAGIGIGGETGNGTLFIDDESRGYYNKSGASIGFQLGAQERSEVIMFMTDAAMQKLNDRGGLEFGVDASAVALDAGAAAGLDSSNIDAEIVAFIFGQAGLMANASLEGTKVTEIDLSP